MPERRRVSAAHRRRCIGLHVHLPGGLPGPALRDGGGEPLPLEPLPPRGDLSEGSRGVQVRMREGVRRIAVRGANRRGNVRRQAVQERGRVRGKSIICLHIPIQSRSPITTTTRLTSVIFALMQVRRSPHDATLPLLSVHCHPWPKPHTLHIPIQTCSPSHPWPAPASAARHFQVPTSAHPIIHLLPAILLLEEVVEIVAV